MCRVPLGRLGVRRVGLRIVKLSVGQVGNRGDPETTVQIRKLLSRSGNYCPDPETWDRTGNIG